LVDELDAEDQQEVHNFVRRFHDQGRVSSENYFTEELSPVPYIYEPGRVFSAITARAWQGRSPETTDWTQLPLLAGVEIIHNMLAHEIYDKLYMQLDPVRYYLRDFRQNFNRRMRNQGVLAFQFIERQNGAPVQPGDLCTPENMVFFPVHELRQPKVLRSHGIRMLAAGFSELRPVDPLIRQRLYDYWESRWKASEEMFRSGYELYANKLRSKARAEGQQEMGRVLNEILNTDIPGEALAIRVFQALEAVAADPTTRQFVPQEVIDMLGTLRSMLLHEDDTNLLK
jgi:hypothetical protein